MAARLRWSRISRGDLAFEPTLDLGIKISNAANDRAFVEAFVKYEKMADSSKEVSITKKYSH